MTYTAEEKRQFVLRYQNGESVSDICTETGIARSTFYTWLKPFQSKQTDAGVIVSPQEFIYLKRRVEKLEDIVKVLKAATCTVSAPLQDKLKALEALYGQYSVRTLCEALEVPRGTFYNHVLRNKKEKKSYQFRRVELSEQIRQIYDESNQIYGAKKIKAVLAQRGVVTSDKMVAELMQEMNIASIRSGAKKTYLLLRNSKKHDKLQTDFSTKTPNQIWVSDVTYFRVGSKMYYICAILNLYSRKVIAYKISQKHSAQLISSTFRTAYTEREPPKGLIFHSDQGTQYTSFSFQKLLKTLHVEQSFSPSGKPCHNAVMESFFASLKREELYRHVFHSVQEFKERVGKYISFYNTERPHSTLGYQTPEAYETIYFGRRAEKEK